MTSRYGFRDASHLRLAWSVVSGEQTLAEGTADLPPVPPGGSADVALDLPNLPLDPTGGEAWLNVDAVLKDAEPPLPAGHVVASAQFAVADRATPANDKSPAHGLQTGLVSLVNSPALRLSDDATSAVASGVGPAGPFEAVFDKRLGRLSTLAVAGRVLIAAGPRLNLWRAPIDNERMGGAEHHVARWWARAHLRDLRHRVDSVEVARDGDAVTVTVAARVAPPTRAYGVAVTYAYRVAPDGAITVRVHGDFHDAPNAAPRDLADDAKLDESDPTRWPAILPRVGVRLAVPDRLAHVAWLGLGPGESYPDSRTAVRRGVWRSTVAAMETPYVYPQEYGNRSDVDRLDLSATDADGLRIDCAAPLNASVHPYPLDSLTAAAHRHDLRRDGLHHVYLDARVNGLGSASCGPRLAPPYQCRPGPFDLAFALAPLHHAPPAPDDR